MTQHFVTTLPRRASCHRCAQLVLDGIEEGFPYRVDPVPLTLIGELTAQLAGRSIYRLIAGHVVRRTVENIMAETLDNRPPVFARHNCAPINTDAISIPHIAETQQLIADKDLEIATATQGAGQQCLITIADVLGGRIIASPDDQNPPF